MKCKWEWLPSLIPDLQNIGILHHKVAKLPKQLQHSVCSYVKIHPNTFCFCLVEIEILIDFMKCQLTWLGQLNQVSYWFINSNISMIRYQKNWGKWLVNYLVGEGSWFWFFFPRYFQEGQKKKKKGWVMLNCKGHIHAALHLFSLVVDGLTLFWGLPINPVGNIWD